MNAPSTRLLEQIAPIDRGADDLPLHAQVRRGLVDLIDRHFEDGQKFWTENILTEQLHVSRITVRRALHDLASAGLLDRRTAHGTFVRKRDGRAGASVAPADTFRSVGVLVPHYSSGFLSELLEHIARECEAQGLRLRTYHLHQGDTPAGICAQMERPPREERLILLEADPKVTAGLTTALAEIGYRSVTLDVPDPDNPGGAHVGTDNAIGVRLAVEYLRRLGHRRIALLVNEPEEVPTVRERIAAFEAVCREQGVAEDCPVVRCGTRLWEDAFEASYRPLPALFAEETTAPTAVFATSDAGALATLRWLAARGVTVPAEVSVVGFDDERAARLATPALTTVAHPMADLAQEAVAMLRRPAQEGRVALLAPTLTVRESTAPAPSR